MSESISEGFSTNFCKIISSTITGPVGTNALSLIFALQEYRAANAAYGKKQTSYKDIVTTNSLDFEALIFESTGKIHPETVRFLNSMVQELSR